MRPRLQLPSPGLIVGSIAVVLALGGGALAASKHGDARQDRTLVQKYLKKNKVARARLADKAAAAAHATLADLATHATTATNADQLAGKPASAYAPATVEPTHEVGAPGEPAFLSGDSNLGSGTAPAGFFKDPFGIVHLQGEVKPVNFGTAVFTLPVGYRPSTAHYFPFAVAGGAGYLRVTPDGDVTPQGGPNGFGMSLDGIEFRVGS